MNEALTDQLSVSAVIVFALQWLKGSKWFPWIHAKTDQLNRALAIALSGLAALGIHMTFEQSTGTLTVTGLTLVTIVTGAWEWAKSYATQEIIYRVVKGSKPVPRDPWTEAERAARTGKPAPTEAT